MKKNMFILILVIFAITSIANCVYAQQSGTFTDSRDSQIYKTVKINKCLFFKYNFFKNLFFYIFVHNIEQYQLV